ncbi:MAG: hypothetical protein V4539_03355 [Bacteroidota bacterium]
MKQHVKHFRHTKQSKIVLVLSILVAAYWYLGKTYNVYQTKVAGAVFEILWLPMIILLFALPIVSIGFFVKDKFNPRSFYLYSLLIGVGAILITMLM